MRNTFWKDGGGPEPVTAVSPRGYPDAATLPWVQQVSIHPAWPIPWVKTRGRNQAFPDVGLNWLLETPVNRARYDRLTAAGGDCEVTLLDATLTVRLRAPDEAAPMIWRTAWSTRRAWPATCSGISGRTAGQPT